MHSEQPSVGIECMADLKGKKFLIINTFGIGDVLFTTPLIENVKQSVPDAFLGYVANARTAEILKNHSLIDEVFVYERDEFHEAYCHSKKRVFKKENQVSEL